MFFELEKNSFRICSDPLCWVSFAL